MLNIYRDSRLRNLILNNSTQNTSTEPTYYFDQMVYDFHMQTPFYFAIKLNKPKMCQLFIEKMKTIFVNSLNQKFSSNHTNAFATATLIRKNNRQQLYLRSNSGSQRDLSVFYHHKACINSYLSKRNFKIYLNSMLNDDELANLLVLALSNKSYDIAMLILSNVSNPKRVLNFRNLSESFIYNKEFCLFLIKNKMVEVQLFLKEAVQRHSHEVTSMVLKYLEDENFSTEAS
jgi:hypothetical protein